ncbi:MAG TPA: alpha/beta hydrolase [Candidatus Binatia bacterium]|nr:alpha/beta hydrolase [Candidatus Binatia bacterium]
MRTTSIILAAFLVTLALPVVAGAIYQAIGTWRDRWRFPPPGRLVRVNARRMHIHVTGKGTPAVVFESGMGASCLSWTLVQPHVAQFTRAISYDRAGHGWSDPAHEPRTAQQIAQELHTLLDAIGLPGPYVLVGHSFGGYVNRAFANMYRNEVVGMVLVDSVHPAEWEHPTPEQLRMIEVGLRYAWIAAWLARLGFVRFCLARLARGSPRLGQAAASTFGADTAAAVQRIAGEIRKLPAPILPIVRALWSQPKNFMSLGRHVAALPVSAAQAAAVSSLGNLPLVVLSTDHHAASYTDWQRDLARLSSRGRHLVVSNSGHWIHLDHPERVTQVISEVVTAARFRALMEASEESLQQWK